MAINIGPKIGIEGEKEYRQELSRIIQQAKTLGSEMSAVTSSFDKNTTAEQKAAATGKVLAEQIANQKDLVSKLSDMVARSAEKYGENSTQTLKWKDALHKAEKGLNDLEHQTDTAADSTDDLGDAFDDAKDAGISFGDVLGANILGDAIMKGFDLLIGKVKELAEGAIDAAATVRAEASQFTQTFGSLEGVADTAIQNIASQTGVLDTRLRSSAAGIYAFARASGADSADALQLMQDGLLAAADNAAYYDKSLEEATDTLQSFLKGNFANDAALGVSATETTRNTAAMKKFNKAYKDLTEVQKQQTLLQMVLDAQELSGAMGQASREADGWENVQGNLNEAVRQFQAAAGQPFLEQMTPRVQKVTKAMQDLQKRIDWEKIAAGVDGVFGWFDEHGAQVVKTIGAAGAAFATWKVVSSLGSVLPTIQAFGSTIATMATALAANPFALAAAGLAALVGVIATHAALTDTETEAMRKNREEREAMVEAADKMLESQTNYNTATWDAANASLAEVENLQDMADKLYGLVDPMGVVQEGRETEAEFIVNELNKALGLEMELIDGQIKGYEDLGTAINGAIASKRLEVLMGAAEENYTNALKTRAELEDDLYDASQKHAKAQDRVTELEKGFWDTVRSIDPNAPIEDKRRMVAAMKEVSDEYIDARNELNATGVAQDQLSKAWAENTAAISTYETAMGYQLKGETQRAISYLTEEANARKRSATVAGNSADQKIAALKREADQAKFYYDEYKKNLAAGVKGFTEEGLEAARQSMLTAQGDLKRAGYDAGDSMLTGVKEGVDGNKDKVTDSGDTIGAALMDGVAAGIKRREPIVTAQIETSFGNFITAARRENVISSPSKVYAGIGDYVMQGFEQGFVRRAATVETTLRDTFAMLPEMTMPDVSLPENRTQNITIPNINVYAQEGQDPTAIAREVERVLFNDLRSTEAAFA